MLKHQIDVDAEIDGFAAPPRGALAWMVREVVAMMSDGLKFPPRLEGDGKGAIIDGFGGRNDAAIAAILVILSEVSRSFVSVCDGTHSGVCHVGGPRNFYVV